MAAEKLTQALAHHRAGRQQEAEALLREIVQAEPENQPAWHGLGAVLHAQGNLAEAANCLERAVELRPDMVSTRHDLGVVLARAEQLDAAIAQLEHAARMAPHSPEVAGALRETLAMRENARAIQFAGRGDLAQAETCCRQAVALTPNRAAAHSNLGNVLKGLGQLDEAIVCFRRAIELEPSDAEVHRKLGVIAIEQQRFATAANWLRQALAINPGLVGAYNQLGAALINLQEFEQAEAALRRLIALSPGHVEGCNNLGVALAKQEKLADAAEWFRRAVTLKPDYAEGHFNLGNALKEENRLVEAEPCFRRALEFDPQHLGARLALAFTLLGMGRLDEGWPHYESRLRMPSLRDVPDREPRWKGEDLHGKTVLVGREQGFGDTLQFIRYADLLRERGARVIVESTPPLAELLRTCPGVEQVAVAGDAIPPYDFALPLLSLPGACGTTLETIPQRGPYLQVDEAHLARWRERLGEGGQRTIAIAWQGHPGHSSDRARSIPLARFEPLAKLDGVTLVSVQKGQGQEQLAEVASDWPIVDLSEEIEDFRDTAAILSCCDLLVTCDSAPAHLAGALGRPVWVALAYVPDWRWMLDRTDSPWYPTTRLFRQKVRGDWEDVFARIAAEVERGL